MDLFRDSLPVPPACKKFFPVRSAYSRVFCLLRLNVLVNSKMAVLSTIASSKMRRTSLPAIATVTTAYAIQPKQSLTHAPMRLLSQTKGASANLAERRQNAWAGKAASVPHSSNHDAAVSKTIGPVDWSQSCSEITPGRSDQGSSPYSRPRQSRGQIASARPSFHRLQPGRGVGSLNRRQGQPACRSI